MCAGIRGLNSRYVRDGCDVRPLGQLHQRAVERTTPMHAFIRTKLPTDISLKSHVSICTDASGHGEVGQLRPGSTCTRAESPPAPRDYDKNSISPVFLSKPANIEVHAKPVHNMAFHRSAVLKRKFLDARNFNTDASSPSQGGPAQDPDFVAKGRGIKNEMPIHSVAKVSGFKRKRSTSDSPTRHAAMKHKINPHTSYEQYPTENPSSDCSSGYVRTDVVYDISLLDELSEALGFGPSGHLESGDPQPVSASADISQHIVFVPSDGRIDRSIVNNT